jgi:hypothetical protein
MNAWWVGVAPAQTTVRCGEHLHRLRWEDGRLRAMDHQDADSERTLAALGAQSCPCLDVLDAWSRHTSDLRVLTLTSRGATDPVALQSDWSPPTPGAAATTSQGPGMQLRRRRRGWTSYAALGASSAVVAQRASRSHVPTDPDDELTELLGLGGGLPHRLATTVAAEWAARLETSNHTLTENEPQLHAALYGRVRAATRLWLGRSQLDVAVTMIRAEEQPSLDHSQGRVQADLPFSWLTQVWARDLAVIWGRFCLAATHDDGVWTLDTVAPGTADIQQVTLALRTPSNAAPTSS